MLLLLGALCAEAGEAAVELPEDGAVPVVEVAGPYSSRQTAEALAGAEWAPSAATPAGNGPDAVYFGGRTVVDVSGRCFPVAGRIYIRLRIVPVSGGARSLGIDSYHWKAFILADGQWRRLNAVNQRAPNLIRLQAEKDRPLTVLMETTPLYSSCKAAFTWHGERGDVVLACGDVEQAVLDSIGVDTGRGTVTSLEEEREADVSFEWSEPAAVREPVTVTAPDGKKHETAWGGGPVKLGLPGADYGRPSLDVVLEMGKSRRTVKIPYRAGIKKEYARLRAVADGLDAADRPGRALFLLRLDQVEDEIGGPGIFGTDWERILERLEEAAAAWEAGPGDYYGRRAGFREDAYVSDVDMTAQPYMLYVSSKPMEKRPLVVYLHGYVPSYDRADWLGPRPMEYLPYEEEGAIYAVPFARSNTDFLTVGESDVLAVMEEVKKRFSVDEQRIYAAGYSMGGSGVWTLLAHYPDIWAGALVLSGRTDYYYWHDLDPAKLSPWLNTMIRANNPMDTPENLAHIPMLVFHGDMDWVVKTGHSTRMVEKLVEMGSPAEFRWVHGADHWRAGVVLYQEEVTKRLLGFRRVPPKRFSRKTFLTKYAKWSGVEVLAVEDMVAPITMQADLEAGEATVGNATLVRAPKDLAIKGLEKLWENAASAYWGKGEWTGREGTPYMCRPPEMPGTFRDLTSKPFAVVYGTGGERAAALKGAAERFARTWEEFTKSPALVFADDSLPAGMERERSLVLFGEAAENTFTGRAAGCLPFSITGGVVTIGSMVHTLGRNEGYIITYPSPFAEHRYVALCGTAEWGGNLSANHKYDFVPDVAVFRCGDGGFQQSDEYIMAGFFDSAWRVDEKLLFRGHLKE
ncbi:MAG: prolyl oligopeptidase family serine peptidase [Planctomycetes bacterium]|nr:prolyl oligopeptidase family serine peptidase [Planctomycetota bacterium]